MFWQSYDPHKVSMLIPKMFFFKWNSCHATTVATAVVAVYYIKTASKWPKSRSASVMTPLSYYAIAKNVFKKFKQLQQQLLQLLLLFIILKQPKNGSNDLLPELWPPLKLVCYFQNKFKKLKQLLLLFIILKKPKIGSSYVLLKLWPP